MIIGRPGHSCRGGLDATNAPRCRIESAFGFQREPAHRHIFSADVAAAPMTRMRSNTADIGENEGPDIGGDSGRAAPVRPVEPARPAQMRTVQPPVSRSATTQPPLRPMKCGSLDHPLASYPSRLQPIRRRRQSSTPARLLRHRREFEPHFFCSIAGLIWLSSTDGAQTRTGQSLG